MRKLQTAVHSVFFSASSVSSTNCYNGSVLKFRDWGQTSEKYLSALLWLNFNDSSSEAACTTTLITSGHMFQWSSCPLIISTSFPRGRLRNPEWLYLFPVTWWTLTYAHAGTACTAVGVSCQEHDSHCCEGLWKSIVFRIADTTLSFVIYLRECYFFV